jgi:haloalkane dehalogenase
MASPQDISPDFPFESHYQEVRGSTLHYIEQGQGDPILFLHGNPTSSYLWRNIIPSLAHLGRCIAVDCIGMGKSDKPDIEYRFVDHVQYVEGFIQALGLESLTLVLHDWGSALGFHYACRHETNVKGLAFMEAILMTEPSWEAMPSGTRQMFQALRTPELGWDLVVNQHIFVEQAIPGSIVRPLTEAEMQQYREPFTDPASRKPIWRWPNELPIAGEPADVVEIVETYHRWLQTTDLPKLLVYATPGALITATEVAWCQQHLKNLTAADIGEGIHYLQEDNPGGIGAALARWYQTLS